MDVATDLLDGDDLPIGPVEHPEELLPWYAKLNDRQRRFVEEYCVDYNATKAAIRAGYSNNEPSAATIGWRLLRNVDISTAKDDYLAGLSMSAAEAVHKLTQWGRGSLIPFLETGTIDLSLPNAKAHLHLLKEVDQSVTTRQTEDSVVETVRTKIKLHDPMAAAVKILEVHGRIINRTDLTSKGNALPGVMLYLPDNGRQSTPADEQPDNH